MSKKLTTAQYAEQYINRFGWSLVPIEAGRKFPLSNNWGNECLDTVEKAREFYTNNPDWNVGLALSPSRMCSIDIDCEDSFRMLLAEFGLPYEDLEQYPTIKGKGKRIEFRVPDGVDLPYCKLNWPSRNDPDGSKHKAAMKAAHEAKQAGDTKREARIRQVAKRWSSYTVVELRASSDGKQRQDVLPPSIHPDTGKPYSWLVQPPKSGEWPTPPEWVLSIWSAWDSFKPQFQTACPWVEEPAPKDTKATKRNYAPKSDGVNVIDEYRKANPLEQALERYGYKKKGKRYLSPHSSTGIAGVHVLPDGERCYIFHGSDPLGGEESGKPVNSFDLFCYYDHNDDCSAAVKAAAEELGIKREPRPIPSMPEQQKSQQAEQPTPEEEQPVKADSHNDEFRCLGYNGSYIYVLPRRSEQVVKLSYGSLSKPSLLQIASLEWWEFAFPKEKGGCDWDMAMNTLLRWCERQGIYDTRNERGRGAWYDNGLPVLHLGSHLVVSGDRKSIHEHRSDYIYTKQARMENLFDAKPSTDEEGKVVADIFSQVNWSKNEHGLLALGWTVLAPICGALKWRPHLWITAQRGAGKSWVQSYVMKPIIGEETLIYCQGGTTEAGIRQALKHDARPVLFDEAESEDVAAARRMQSVLELARQASSDTGAEIVKGTANGDGMTFNVRSMFMLGSINVGLKQAADESRFSVVSLNQPEKSPEEVQRFHEFEKAVLGTLTYEFCASLRARTYHLIPTIRANASLFAQAVAESLGSQRMGDQIGTLLAGAFSVSSEEQFTLEECRAIVKRMDFSEAKESEEYSDEMNCINHILQQQVRVEFEMQSSTMRSIGELVDIVANNERMGAVGVADAEGVLHRHGLKVEDDCLLIANTHKELKRALNDTPWASGHKRLLLRIDGAISSDSPSRFAGSISRYVKIPIKSIR